MRPISLYVHVPFCKRRCSYCTFYHVPHIDEFEDAFVTALVREFRSVVAEIGEPFRIPTVFFGGGTPSVLGAASLDKVFGEISPFLIDDDVEVTFETNPEDVCEELLTRLRGAGVNRISLGIQSMNADAQRTLKRCSAMVNRKSVQQVKRHFANFSLDLLLGVPGGSTSDVASTLSEVMSFAPKHLSIYCLEGGGVMEADVRDFLERIDPAQSADEYLYVCDELAGAGYRHYEVSNFCIPGYESRHNQVYWNREDYVGIGPGAHSCVQGNRYFNEPSLERYIADADGARDGIRQSEPRTGEVRRLEDLMLGLRTSNGVPLEGLECDETVISDLVTGRLARCADDRLRLTDRGYLLLNEILHRLTHAA